MCGIVGYVGRRDALDIVVDALRRMEYRGYDSAGVAILDGEGSTAIQKKALRLENLEKQGYHLQMPPPVGCRTAAGAGCRSGAAALPGLRCRRAAP